jgi:2-iminobutanoate/2-iminopropanoate deaminase
MFRHINLPEGTLPAVSPYSHAVRAGDFLFVTGQLAQDPETGKIIRGPIADQTRRVMENLKLVLDQENTSFDKVAMARIFVTDFRFFETVNEVYQSYFTPGQYPGRTAIGVTALAGFGDVEIDLVVYCGE